MLGKLRHSTQGLYLQSLIISLIISKGKEMRQGRKKKKKKIGEGIRRTHIYRYRYIEREYIKIKRAQVGRIHKRIVIYRASTVSHYFKVSRTWK